ncbi:MAG: hypothetical protein U0K68_05115 [Agathobacter sp.]|nr:hypothetical protein [Agathobacter sp.]
MGHKEAFHTDSFIKSLEEKKVPILVLDQKWHRLFAIHGKNDEIKNKEQELDSLLALQGKLTNEVKELKNLKNQLMNDIMENMDSASSDLSDDKRNKKLDDNKRLIDEINEKIDNEEDALLDIHAQIKVANEELMILSMDYFYEKIRVNKQESDEINEWINNIRVELKKNIIKKQNRDINNKEIYSYLHDIFGMELIELFDIQYDELGASD